MIILELLLGVYVTGFIVSLLYFAYHRYKDGLLFNRFGITKDIELCIGWPLVAFLIYDSMYLEMPYKHKEYTRGKYTFHAIQADRMRFMIGNRHCLYKYNFTISFAYWEVSINYGLGD